MTLAKRITTILSAFLIAALVACAPTATREGTGQYIDDTIITSKVKAALAADPDVKATEVNVETFKGDVQLSGFVSSPEHVQKAVELTRNIEGVKSVKNDMRIK
ncbi:BON domain-containing protein [Massilia glaciei]|uniref:Osmotically-inducible protein Y n=1 Tax=Massilia glaciei TaxID=1524097 RepID=A0A2U2I631_9BURK|nr:BON domain-containing protein [Massilia glaciei]PWF55221.1 BON domain-containing protein [Massilia glaciei]